MTIASNRHSRRKPKSQARKGRTIKPLPRAALRAEADRVLSPTQIAALTQTAQPLSSAEAAELGRRFAELGSAIAALPQGAAKHRELIVERIAVVNRLLNGGRYYDTVQHLIDYVMEGEPGPTRPAAPNDTTPGADVWQSAEARYYEQTAFARGLSEACAPVLGRARAFGFALEVLLQRDGFPVRMLAPAQTRSSTSDDHYRRSLKSMAVQRWAFEAAVEGVARTEILRRANGPVGADLIAAKTFENWVDDTDPKDTALAEQLGLARRNGTEQQLPAALQLRLHQLLEMPFPQWVKAALAKG